MVGNAGRGGGAPSWPSQQVGGSQVFCPPVSLSVRLKVTCLTVWLTDPSACLGISQSDLCLSIISHPLITCLSTGESDLSPCLSPSMSPPRRTLNQYQARSGTFGGLFLGSPSGPMVVQLATAHLWGQIQYFPGYMSLNLSHVHPHQRETFPKLLLKQRRPHLTH